MRSLTICIQISALLIIIFESCAKPAGPGGRAMVKGKVYVHDFDNTFKYLISSGYSPGEKVYIVYGNNTFVGNSVTTSYDGSFEFMYLNKGHYKIFANSIDTSYKIKGNKTTIAVVREFDINDPKKVITVEDIVINK
ncbi:MAG TPA: hypothetical protein VN026_10450 [Bacteroidia bacterium]|jgi:hypothetical protein|nr:hypothetical protein [Bacteroidia bacterium]